jgi:beta-glucosidase
MNQFTMHFPKGFKWGTATAAHQVEGDNTNNQWWQWEQTDGHIINNDKSGIACDWWRNAERDFDLMAAMGLNAHRLSIEWSRVEPREGVFDQYALDRYRQMLVGLRQRGIEPMVTLHHFTNPIWLEEQNAWESHEKVVPLFERFVRKAVQALGDVCDLWCTVNEPNIYAVMGYLSGGRMPPGRMDFDATLAVLRNLLLGHAAAYHAIHELQPRARVGLAHHMRHFEGLRAGNVLDALVARLQSYIFNDGIVTALMHGQWNWLLRRHAPSARPLGGTLDWIGLNYYTRQRTRFDHLSPNSWYGTIENTPGAVMSDFDYGEIYPLGLQKMLRKIARYKLPIYVTENGIPDHDDDLRPSFLVSHLREVWKGVQYCFYIHGYYHWSFVDNFEWSEGWRMKFGLHEMNHFTQARTPRPSAALFADIVQSNAISSAIIQAHVPELLPELFR